MAFILSPKTALKITGSRWERPPLLKAENVSRFFLASSRLLTPASVRIAHMDDESNALATHWNFRASKRTPGSPRACCATRLLLMAASTVPSLGSLL